jgi:hypothetical protein
MAGKTGRRVGIDGMTRVSSHWLALEARLRGPFARRACVDTTRRISTSPAASSEHDIAEAHEAVYCRLRC